MIRERNHEDKTMEHTKHQVGHKAAKAVERKDWSCKKPQDDKGWNGAGLCELELKIRMEVGLIGKMVGKEEKKDGKILLVQNDTKEKSRKIDDLKMRSVYGKRTSVETFKKEIKETMGEKVIMRLYPKDESLNPMDVNDYLVLLKALHISLPKGVLNPKVIKISQNADIIEKAQDIVNDLESFKIQFNKVPRLGCREVKNSLALKNNGKVFKMAMRIFFEKRKDAEKTLRARWKENTSNTVCGFRFRHKYQTEPISTPAMYATTQTRSWKHLEVGDNLANVCVGTMVKIHDIENRKYCDESTLPKSPSTGGFGKFFQNPFDELECLKFFHELGEIGNNKNLRYTRNIKVDFGFLSGKMDFLAEVTRLNVNEKRTIDREKIVIECKGTEGDMVGKLFTKPKNGDRHAQLKETHEYCYQVQTYMYILNRSAEQTQTVISDRAVMVIRHYHKNGQEPRDFYWNFLEKNEAIQQQIDELCAFCQEEVLACFLAVLNLIFQPEI